MYVYVYIYIYIYADFVKDPQALATQAIMRDRSASS